MSKPIKYGFCVIRNEESCIRGWAKQNLLLCEKVVAIIDPETTDKTEEILKTEFPEIEIIYQDRMLGDSDYGNAGSNHSLIMHNNLTKFVTERIQEGEWFMTTAADERFALESIPTLIKDIKYAKAHEMGAVCHERLYDVIPVNADQIKREPWSCYFITDVDKPKEPNLFNYVIDFADIVLRHGRIECKTPNWRKNPEPHSGYSERYNPLITHVPLWHFHRIKHHQITESDWRDGLGGLNDLLKKYNNTLPVMQMRIPFDDWTQGLEYSNKDIDKAVYEANHTYKDQYMKVERYKQTHKPTIDVQVEKMKMLKWMQEKDRVIWLDEYYTTHDYLGNEIQGEKKQ